MDDSYPGTSSTPPPASNNDEPSTSFCLSDSNWNSPVSGDVPVEAHFLMNHLLRPYLQLLLLIKWKSFKSVLIMVTICLLKMTSSHGFSCIILIICPVIFCMLMNITFHLVYQAVESVSDDNELPLPSALMTPVSKNPIITPTVSQSLASARMALSNVTEFLTLPSSTSVKTGKPPGRARVLTSEESLAMMLEKEQKKKEEEEAKERRKLERVEKKLQRETEMKKKAEERELKAIEKKRKAAEAEAEREKKQKEREMKAIERQKMAEEKQKAAEARSKQKELKNGTQNFTKVFVTRSKSCCAPQPAKSDNFTKVFATRSKSRCAPQPAKNDSDVCTVCFGNYADDLDESGTQARDWIQCTSCKKWMHEDCAPKTKRSSIVCVCVVLFSCN